jgi:hypothetical protein
LARRRLNTKVYSLKASTVAPEPTPYRYGNMNKKSNKGFNACLITKQFTRSEPAQFTSTGFCTKKYTQLSHFRLLQTT